MLAILSRPVVRTEHLYEEVYPDNPLRVDRKAGVIRGVRIGSRYSKNKTGGLPREYSDEAYRQLLHHYEGAQVNYGHPPRGTPGIERKFEDAAGWLENVRDENGGAYGDLHVLKEHPNSGMLFEAAERNPKRFGLSHNVDGVVERTPDGRAVVKSIENFRSVDLVHKPATNESLFESFLEDDTSAAVPFPGNDDGSYDDGDDDPITAAIRQIVADDSLSRDEKIRRINKLIGEKTILPDARDASPARLADALNGPTSFAKAVGAKPAPQAESIGRQAGPLATNGGGPPIGSRSNSFSSVQAASVVGSPNRGGDPHLVKPTKRQQARESIFRELSKPEHVPLTESICRARPSRRSPSSSIIPGTAVSLARALR